jgi:hypothetical protein
MGVTPIFGFPYPEDSTPNDLHAFFMNLASAVETELVRQGTLANRPAAGVLGRFYNATDDSLFRDDGTNWIRLTPGPWKNFPTTTPLRLQNGGGGTITTVSYQWQASPICRYRLLPGNRVEYEMSGLGHLSGTPTNQFVGIEWTAPTAMEAGFSFVGAGDIFNDAARVVAVGGIIAAYPTGGYLAGSYLGDMVGNNRTAYQTFTATGWNAGRWPIDNVDRAVCVRGVYATS